MVRTLPGTPAQDGYRMPAEWEPHDGCWLVWPENTRIWRRNAEPAQRSLAMVANTLADTGEHVTVTVSAAGRHTARAALGERIRLVEADTTFAWARDVAPSFVVNGDNGRRGVRWIFNGYGNRLPAWQADARYADIVLATEKADSYLSPLVLEGGAVHVDGVGTALTTAECVLDPRRNPGLDTDAATDLLRRYLGVSTVLWLPRGLVADETPGHVDNMACFTAPGTVCLAWTDDARDPQHERGAAALDVLNSSTDAAGCPLTVVKLPLPGPLHPTSDESDVRTVPAGRLAASYVNFYIGNHAVLLPSFGVDTDREAETLLRAQFPDREVIALPTRETVLGGGNLHCLTQQVPAAIPTQAGSGAEREPRT